MGFFDKVRTLKNAITGGGAEVSVEIAQATPGEAFEVIVRAQVAEDAIDIDRVYLQIRGSERVEVPDVEVVRGSGDDEESTTETVSVETETFSLEVNVADQQTLAANEEYEWRATAELPSDALPRYRGKLCEHAYEARASLDCTGNDPDSGWVEFEVA